MKSPPRCGGLFIVGIARRRLPYAARMALHVVTPAPLDVWTRLVGEDPLALPYQTPEWLDAICRSPMYSDASRWYRLDSGAEAVVPLVRRSPLPKRIAPAAPLPDAWGIGGVVVSKSFGAEDLGSVVADLGEVPALHLRIRPNPLRTEMWDAIDRDSLLATQRRVHVLDLEGGYDKVWRERFASKTRTGVRHALNAGVEVEVGNSPVLVDAFHEVLSTSVDRWAEQQNEPLALARARFRMRDPKSKFYRIAASLGDICRIWVARHDGKAVAAAMRLVLSNGNANASRSAMVKELAAPLRANDLLQQRAIEDACASGCRYFVLGESGGSQGIARYKARFGGAPVDYREFHIDPWR